MAPLLGKQHAGYYCIICLLLSLFHSKPPNFFNPLKKTRKKFVSMPQLPFIEKNTALHRDLRLDYDSCLGCLENSLCSCRNISAHCVDCSIWLSQGQLWDPKIINDRNARDEEVPCHQEMQDGINAAASLIGSPFSGCWRQMKSGMRVVMLLT
jgi:hypothetical protein